MSGASSWFYIKAPSLGHGPFVQPRPSLRKFGLESSKDRLLAFSDPTTPFRFTRLVLRALDPFSIACRDVLEVVHCSRILLALTSSANAQALISPPIGVRGKPEEGDVQSPSPSNPCSNVNIAQGNADGTFSASIENFVTLISTRRMSAAEQCTSKKVATHQECRPTWQIFRPLRPVRVSIQTVHGGTIKLLSQSVARLDPRSRELNQGSMTAWSVRYAAEALVLFEGVISTCRRLSYKL